MTEKLKRENIYEKAKSSGGVTSRICYDLDESFKSQSSGISNLDRPREIRLTRANYNLLGKPRKIKLIETIKPI